MFWRQRKLGNLNFSASFFPCFVYYYCYLFIIIPVFCVLICQTFMVVVVQSLNHVRLSVTSWTEHARLPCSSLCPRVFSDSCPSSRWCYLTISSSAVPFSFCLQSLPVSGSFPGSQLFTSDGQSIGASASVLPMNIQGWFPLGLAGLTSWQSKGLSRVFSNTTVQKHKFFSAQLSSQSNSHIHLIRTD